MIKSLFSIATALFAIAACADGHSDNDLKLEFTNPASVWEETLPLGNGRLGAMPDGGIATEHIVLNEESMWSGCEWNSSNPEAGEWLPVIRQKLAEGNNWEAQQLMYRHFVCTGGGGTNPRYGCYQTLGAIDIKLEEINPENVTSYTRSLSLRDAVASSTLKTGRQTISRECFVSIPDDVVAIQLTSNGKLPDFSISLSRAENAVTTASDNGVIMQGELPSGDPDVQGVRFYTEARVIHNSRREATILLSAATTYNTENPKERVDSLLNEAAKKSYSELRERHIAAHRELFDRVEVSLGAADNSASSDSAALYLQYGRYLLIGSTARATLPPNLQGIWADGCGTPWNGDYHLNINVEMNHWPALPGNIAEADAPLTDYVEGLVPSGRNTAKVFYNAPGWTANVLANVWHFTSPAENPQWGASLTGGAWLSLQLWEHYQFTMDLNYLKRVYPVMREAAGFLHASLYEQAETGWLVTGPSSSPENAFRSNGKVCNICEGPTMDIQICQELFNAVIKASGLMGIDKEFADSLASDITGMPPMQIAEGGYLQEWLKDYQEVEPTHRHVSHLFGLYPGTTINTPELSEAARQTLERRGDGGTGWSRAWKINFWARLGDGNRAYKLFKSLLQPVYPAGSGNITYGGSGAGTYPNLFCAHPPFQIDGNFGGSAGLMEMLLQSHKTENGKRVIAVLPAIPDEWSQGHFKGLMARGDIEVSCYWSAKKGVDITLSSPVPQDIIIEAAGKRIPASLKSGRVSIHLDSL